MKSLPRAIDLALAGLVGLYLGAATWAVASHPPLTFSAVWKLGPPGSTPAVGPVGVLVGQLAQWGAGPWLRWLLPAVPLVVLLWATRPRRNWRQMAWFVGTFFTAAGLLAHPAWARLGLAAHSGGAIGAGLHAALLGLVGSLGSFLLLAAAWAVLVLRPLPPLHVPLPMVDGLAERLRWPFGAMGRWIGRLKDWTGRAGQAVAALASRLGGRFEGDVLEVSERKATFAGATAALEITPAPTGPRPAGAVIRPEAVAPTGAEDEYEDYPDGDYAEDAQDDLESFDADGDQEFRMSRDPAELLAESRRRIRRRHHYGAYKLPALDLLNDVVKEERGFSRDVLQMKARLLMETLANYGIEGRINEIRPGPVVTTFEFEPAPGVKVSQITSRADDLALAMKAIRIRIEAPIPGKAAVGIEIPNPYPQVVGLKEVMQCIPDEGGLAPLTIALGKDTEGNPHLADLADMPHLLVAGATGSGKSVCMNSLICNLLLRNGPDRVRLLMVDPKMLELSVYNGIPHLLHPVITEAREALKAVKWMVAEMSVRYHKLAKHSVRNIKDYNDKIKAGQVKDAEGKKVRDPMPYYVVIIDELADLMMTLGQDLETPIARLAQMARAVGIHLVLATQRPSVNVITGIIKANFPSRIAFRVVTKVDSRTILDCTGAEQLLGKGDMLFLLAGMPQPVRVHGAFLSIDECERIVEHWHQYTDEEARLDLDESSATGSVDLGEDDLLDEARRLVVTTQTGSTSMLQRRLRVGYTRAARLMDMLEEAGVVGPFEGSKAREVLVRREEIEAEG